MKTRAGISKKFILGISMLFSLMVVLMSLAFYFILRENQSVIEETLIRSSEYILLEKARNLTERLENRPVKNLRALSERLQDLCAEDDSFLHVIIFSKTADENYFEVEDSIPFSRAVDPGLSKKSVVKEDRSVNYLKKGLFRLTADPEPRETAGVYWQTVYSPYRLNNRTLVLAFLLSSDKTRTMLHEYAAGITRIKRYIVILAVFLVGAVCAAGFLFMHNFSILIENLARSLRKAARGDLNVNLNTAADEELSELAHSFNSLIGEMKDLKAREKIVQELETKDTMGDIFKFGVSLLKEHRLDESIALFRTLTILKPEGFGGYFNLGVAYAKKGEYAESIEMFKRALQANPRHELTLQYIEKVKHLQSRHDETYPGPRQ